VSHSLEFRIFSKYSSQPNCSASTNNKSAQSNLGRGPRRGAVAHVRPIGPLDNGAPQIRPKSTRPRGLITKPHYLPHPWTCPIYDAERHLDPIRHFPQCTGQTDRPTDQPTDVRTYIWTGRLTDRPRESLTTIGRCAPRVTWPKTSATIAKTKQERTGKMQTRKTT